MALALLSLRQAQKVEPQLKAALMPEGETLTARERLAKRDGLAATPLTARQYVQKLNGRARELAQEQVSWALGRVEPEELDGLLRHIAKLRGRYATLVLEHAQSDRPLRREQLNELKLMREQIEELNHGLELLKEVILDGTAEVRGVKVVD
ncbi:hypothetical protein [Ferrovibrio sp.]|uniref:hypothetical protein n=1 Tax=Ferrovibrio sp. TaxID=1917215 RepID=UPI0025C6E00E|nr:hypothetical protein [Ferrovibrio sp.]MBX3454503.1 hypothetical protein [Ferrovibrio sp.]